MLKTAQWPARLTMAIVDGGGSQQRAIQCWVLHSRSCAYRTHVPSCIIHLHAELVVMVKHSYPFLFDFFSLYLFREKISPSSDPDLDLDDPSGNRSLDCTTTYTYRIRIFEWGPVHQNPKVCR